ncbi:DNA adenine methylase [Desulfofundulus luciae]|uniref:DNA adenine methylase n=1 Tax=Desulfofundulus luciae TaxID=74702 RepID=A0ABU0B516_9FIRM|nr:DNA adenine methylase [Desulfofundulus luciae]MDQ0287810.1 DNA adenine methylase [Desulfofundulus luciae]
MQYYSPLRYPGGKAKLGRFFKLLCEANMLCDGYYIEPYCGGASVALDLLINEYVIKVFINDIDRAIYSFWFSVLNETEILCKKIYDTPVNMDEWKRQRLIYYNQDNVSTIDLGFAAFFLNRTNRSGILNKGGVIGGINQNGKWKIDARYNKVELIKRIERIALYKDRIYLANKDAMDFLSDILPTTPYKTLIYLDPPYFNKGKDLYLNYYNYDDHKRIAEFITKVEDKFWVITYDNVNEIKAFYHNYRQMIYNLNYSANKCYKGQEVVIFSHQISIPESVYDLFA